MINPDSSLARVVPESPVISPLRPFPSVVLELSCGAPWARFERSGQALELTEALPIAFVAEILEEPERAPAGAINAAVDAFDVILVTASKCIYEGVAGRADGAYADADGKIICRQCPRGDTLIPHVPRC
jgi:hypothetical protein